MLLAVDPDVLNAAQENSLCDVTIGDLLVNVRKRDLWFAVDESSVKEEYARLLLQYSESKKKHKTALGFLQYALGGRKKTIASLPSPAFQRFLDDTPDCSTPVEPELLGMAVNEPSLKLLLVGEVPDLPCVRNRGLNSPEIRHRLFRYVGKKVSVIFAVDTEVNAAPFRDTPEKKWLDHWFEDVVALKLQAQEPDLRCVAPPDNKFNRQGEKEQIDVYGYRALEAGQSLVVGECKLPEEGNEHRRLISLKDIRQVLRKLMSAAACEWHRSDTNFHEIVQIEGVIISTAGQFWDTEATLIPSVQRYLNQDHSDATSCVGINCSLRFVKARLRHDFLRHKRLEIVGMDTWKMWRISCQHDGQGGVRWQVQAFAK